MVLSPVGAQRVVELEGGKQATLVSGRAGDEKRLMGDEGVEKILHTNEGTFVVLG